ncbi:STAS/SEC14 domain-containing protein [Microbulbifer echini]|uniref:STAS/SEC14 domain-containing protein n=1 Tax=Microbulbifer echini TaxID=1529067 RepID=A0ABV4NNR2_9GAMM|nr:STAS/SEC14 domain-containing protein [uncultured Microbulbifer sp.]
MGRHVRRPTAFDRMIEHKWIQGHKILQIQPHGAFTVEDFHRLAEKIDPIIREQGRIEGLLIDTRDFAGWKSFVAMISHFRFVHDHEKHIQRIAVVSDNPVLKFMPHLVCHFISAEVRPFTPGEYSEALEWLENSG